MGRFAKLGSVTPPVGYSASKFPYFSEIPAPKTVVLEGLAMWATPVLPKYLHVESFSDIWRTKKEKRHIGDIFLRNWVMRFYLDQFDKRFHLCGLCVGSPHSNGSEEPWFHLPIGGIISFLLQSKENYHLLSPCYASCAPFPNISASAFAVTFVISGKIKAWRI